MNNSTIMGQILQMFPRFEFQKAVAKIGTEYHARGFSSWNHFAALLFGQLAGQDSLRSIEAGLATQAKSLYHLGIEPVHRSTLAYANENRSFELFQTIFFEMLSKCQEIAPRHKFRFKNPLYSIDATTIDLCLSLYDWAKFRKTKGAVKLHVKLNHSGYLPSFVLVTDGKVHEQKAAPFIPLEEGDVAVFDRGYNKLDWLKSLDNKGVFFVTRLKCNAQYKVLERHDVSKHPSITSDQIIEWTNEASRKKYPGIVRRIRSVDPVTKKSVVLITNNFEWSQHTIAKIYKERWQIEDYATYLL